MRAATASGSKVITNPGELGSDLLELLVERDGGLGHAAIVAAEEARLAANGHARHVAPGGR